MDRALDIAIVGYGIAGIAAAIHLQRAGHRVTRFERTDPPTSSGAGMLLHPAAMRLLERIGVLPTAIECGAPVRRIRAQTVQGRMLMDLGYGDVTEDPFGLGIQRGTLHRLLSSADPGRDRVLGGHKIVSVDAWAGFLVDAEHHRHGPFDLIVLADGTHSGLREQVVGSHYDRRASSAALVGLIDDPGGVAADHLTQYFESTRHLGVWPVGRAFIGDQARCAVAISVSPAEAETVRREGRWRGLLTHLHPDLRTLLGGVAPPDLRVFTYRDVELARSCVGRVAFIGDAAHCMSPQLGTGAQLAMDDAEVLARVLGSHLNVAEALRAFMRIREPQVRRHQLASRLLTPLFQTDNRAIAFLRDNVFANALHFASMKRMAQELFV